MNLFQIVTLPLVGLLFIRSIVRLARSSQARGIGLLSATIWLLAAVAILWPDLTMRVASMLGIGRGADLVLYALVITFLLLVFYTYNRFRKIDSNITEIVRQLAIRDALQHSPQSDHDVRREEKQTDDRQSHDR